MSQLGDSQPWLKNKQWAAREVRYGKQVRLSFLVLLYFICGLMAVIPVLVISDSSQPFADRAGVLLVLCVLLLAAAAVTYVWLRHRRYGDSVCRLITLPGVIGGWFKADVECALPPDLAEPIIVRLRNWIPGGRSPVEVWRMEEKLTVHVAEGARSVVL